VTSYTNHESERGSTDATSVSPVVLCPIPVIAIVDRWLTREVEVSRLALRRRSRQECDRHPTNLTARCVDISRGLRSCVDAPGCDDSSSTMSTAKLSFPSSSNAFTAVKAASSRRDSIQPGIDRNGVKRVKLSFGRERDDDFSKLNETRTRLIPLRIRLLANRTARPVFDHAQASQKLISAFPVILSDRPLPDGQSLETLYRLCQTIVTTPIKNTDGPASSSLAKSQAIFAEIHEKAKEALRSSAVTIGKDLRGSIMARDASAQGVALLRTILDKWTSWEICSIRLNSILLHLDRTYVMQTEGLASLRELSLEAFRLDVLQDQLVEERYLQAIMKWVDSDRRSHDALTYVYAATTYLDDRRD
jgi:hypothetical protein